MIIVLLMLTSAVGGFLISNDLKLPEGPPGEKGERGEERQDGKENGGNHDSKIVASCHEF